MLVLRNIIAVGCSVIVAIALVIVTSASRWTFAPAAFIALAASMFGVWQVTGREVPRSDRLMLGAPCVLSVVGALGLLLFLESSVMRGLVIALIALLQASYLTHVFFFLHVPSRYSPHALESVSSFMHFLTVFSVATATFGLGLFTEIPFAVLLLPLMLILGTILFQALWVAKIQPERARLLAGIGAILLTELAASFAFLPTSLYVNGAAIALGAYALHFIFRVSPTDPHFLRTARRATLLASSLLVVLLASAPWR